MENLYEGVVLEEWEIKPFSMEEKILFSREETIGLVPEEIREIVEEAMGSLLLDDVNVDMTYDVIYDAIQEALIRVNNRM